MGTTAQRIRAKRLALGITEEQLAARLHVHQSTVSKWENGRTVPTFLHVVHLARALGCSVDDLAHGLLGTVDGAGPVLHRP